MSLIGGLLITFQFLLAFCIGTWMADVACPVVCQPCLACLLAWILLIGPPRRLLVLSRMSGALRDAVSRSSVDDFWFLWSSHAEGGLFRAYSRAGGPTEAGSAAFLGRGLLRIRSRRLGGGAVGGRGSVGCSSGLLGGCMSLWSVWSCLLLLSLGRVDSSGFTWFLSADFDSLQLLNGFLHQVVVSRRDVGTRKWVTRLREDLSSRPYAWLRPDFVPPSPFLVVKDPQTQSSQILLEPHLTDAEFRKAWLLFFL